MVKKLQIARLLFTLIIFALLSTGFGSITAQDDGGCSDDDEDDRIDAFEQRHPDDGSYIGAFANVENSDLNSLILPLYSPQSPLNQPIPADAAIDPDSDARIELLAEQAEDGILLSFRAWTMSAYVTDANTPRHDVELTACWSPFGVMLNVPIPDGALPDPVGDGGMAILALDEGYEYDFWQIEQLEDGRWQAAWGNRTPLDGDGNFVHGFSARGSGFTALAGLIWPAELDAGRIEHALIASIPEPAAGGPIYPATESDGFSSNPLALPEGARLQLNPDLDLDSLDLTPWQRTIAETLQTYGVFIADIGGTDFEIEAVNAISWSSWPFGQHFDDLTQADYEDTETGGLSLDMFSIEDFRVLVLGNQNAYSDEESSLDETLYADPRYDD